MKILYASSNLPYPPNSGGSQRTELLYRSLCELGSVECVFFLPRLPTPLVQAYLQRTYRIKYIATKDEILAKHDQRCSHCLIPESLYEAIESFFLAGRYRWRPHPLTVDLLGSLDCYDLVVARYLQVAAIFDLFRSERLVVDLDDYDPDRLHLRMEKSDFYKNLTLKRSLFFSKLAHDDLLKKVPRCWISNPTDRQHRGLENATLLKNIPFPDNFLCRSSKTVSEYSGPYFLMVGSMDYSANENAADAFVQRTWRRVVETYPNVKFIIVGNNMNESQLKRWRSVPGVIPLGFVADLAPLYLNALAVVAPIQFGAGTNIKVLESAAFGCATVLTQIAQRGFENHFIHNESCLLANTVEGMANECLKLLADPSLASRLGENARRVIDAHYSYTHFRDSVHSLCQKTLSTRFT